MPDLGEIVVDLGESFSEEAVSEERNDSLRKAKGTALPNSPGWSESPLPVGVVWVGWVVPGDGELTCGRVPMSSLDDDCSFGHPVVGVELLGKPDVVLCVDPGEGVSVFGLILVDAPE